MDARERRLAENEILFREVNERIADLAAGHADDDHLYEFMCECSNVDCTLRIELTVADYEAVRADGALFAVAKGHLLPEIEQVVGVHDGFDVIRKVEDAGELARDRDPRG
jgi:hypothetical protein